MSRIAAVLIAVLVTSCLWAPRSDAADQTPAGGASETPSVDRYHYCNVYVDEVCFGISGSDKLEMSIPIDFVIYQLSLDPHISGFVYVGFAPNQAVFKEPRSCKSGGEAKCIYVSSDSGVDILYLKSSKADYIHVHLAADDMQAAKPYIRAFLGNFRSCERKDETVACSDRRPFAKVEL